MLRNRGISVLILAIAAAAVLVPAESAYAATEGAGCTKPGQTVTAGSSTLKCLTISGTRSWIRLTRTPSDRGTAARLISSWMAGANPDWVTAATASVTPEAQAQAAQQLILAQQDRDAKVAAAAAANASVATMKNELDGLPSRVASAQAEIKPAEDALQQPKAEMQAAIAAENALSAAYGVALNNQAAHIACTISGMFGYGGCLSTVDTWSATIAQYNLAKARTDAAIAKYKSYYDAYLAKYNVYKALYDRQVALTAEYNAALPEVQAASNAAQSAEGSLATAHTRIDRIAALQSALAQHAVSLTSLTQAARAPLPGATAKWAAAFERTAFIAAKHRVYTQRVQRAFASLAAMG